jgi:hypothetical protein
MSTSSNKSSSRSKTSNKRTRKPSTSKPRKSRKATPIPEPVIVLHKPHVERLPTKYKALTVYRIKFDLPNGKECVTYMDNANKHAVFRQRDGTFGLFHLEDKPIKESLIVSCKTALTKLLTKYKSNPPPISKNTGLMKDIVLLQSCEMDLDLREVQSELDKLNKMLHKGCPHLTIRFAPFHEFLIPMARYSEHGEVCIGCNFYDTMILGLCSAEACISTIEVKIAPDGEVVINSKTDTAFEGNKYNKMMRLVLFIIAKKIQGLIHVKSVAINPISVKLLIHDSDALLKPDDKDNDLFKEYLQTNRLADSKGNPKRDIPMESIQRFYSAPGKKVNLIIPITDSIAKSSYDKFVALMNESDIYKKVKC